jgi:hypothetical protein
MPSAAETALAEASKGLVYLSETDAPFETFSWGKAAGGLTSAKVRKLAKAPARAPVEEVPLEDFFRPLTEEHDHTPEEAEDIRKYQGLLQVVHDQLADATVYRVGRVNVDVYLVGRANTGDWVGLKTEAVET